MMPFQNHPWAQRGGIGNRLRAILEARAAAAGRIVTAPEGRTPRPHPIPDRDSSRARLWKARFKAEHDQDEALSDAVGASQPWYTSVLSQVGDLAGKYLGGKAQLELAKVQARNQADLTRYTLQQQAAAWSPGLTAGASAATDAQRRYEAEQRALALERATGTTAPMIGTGTLLAVAGVGLLAVLVMKGRK